MLTRRRLITQASLAAAAFATRPFFSQQAVNVTRFARLKDVMAALEKTNGGRLGVFVLDTASGEHGGYRQDELFPMCSTFKFLLAAAVLHRVDTQMEDLRRQVDVPTKPLLGNSPLTEPHAGGSMTVGDLCHAALTRSDNTAANILLESVGGPTEFTRSISALGDTITRLDRNEPTLNTSIDGDPRDTTSPAAMAADLQKILVGTALKPASKMQLTDWMQANLTGLTRLRKDLPGSWSVADKTGANGEHTSNDIAVLWPDHKVPVIVTAYITQCPGPEVKRAAMLAEVGHYVRENMLLEMPNRNSRR